MSGLKSLAKDTAVYGLSSIVGRFLNWCLVPLYVYIFPSAEYGIVSYLYSFTAVALVILNYGMETSFFRYAGSSDNPEKVYTTSLWSVGTTSLFFIAALLILLRPVSKALLLPHHSLYVALLGIIVAIDAFTNLSFAYLRFRNKAWRFAGIKLLNVGVNIGLNLFFLLACPAINKSNPALISWFYSPLGGEGFGIGWIFIANLISSAVVLICLLPFLIGRRWGFDGRLLKRMLSYAWPLLILGVAGVLSQNMGQIVIPYLFKSEPEAARSMVGIYSANMKIAIVMVMFTQAFRYAYEPFIFAKARGNGEDKRQAYCDAMKYFVIFGLLIFIGVEFFLPILKHFISPGYWSGLQVVPVMMAAELCFGVFFNLSLWYKLTDRTVWGMYLSVICFLLMLGFNLLFVPMIGIPRGFMGSAWAALLSYFIVMVISWILGRRYYPLDYELGRMLAYTLLAGILWVAGSLATFSSEWLSYTVRLLLILIYCGAVWKFDLHKLLARR